MMTIAMVDFLIFDFWLPQKFENQLSKSMTGGDLSFEDVELNWRDGRIKGGKWTGPKHNLLLEEGSFSYSSFDWFFSEHSQIKHLVLNNFRLVETDATSTKFNIGQVLKNLRLNPLDFGCDSIDMSGRVETNESVVPFSMYASHSKHEKAINADIKIGLEKIFPSISKFFLIKKTLSLKVHLRQKENLGKRILRISIYNENLGQFIYVNNGESEAIELSLGFSSNNSTKLSFTADRKIGANLYSGVWNIKINSQSLANRFPILSFINGALDGAGDITFDTLGEKINIYGDGNFSVSSIFFPKEGVVRGQVTGHSKLINKNWGIEDFRILLENDMDEQIEANINSPFSDFKKIEELNLSFNSFNIGRLDNHFPEGSRLSGSFEGDFIKNILTLSSKNLRLKTKGKTQDGIKATFETPIASTFIKDKGIDFDIETSPDFKIVTGLIPQSYTDFNKFSSGNLHIKGVIKPTFWLVNEGEVKFLVQDKDALFNFKVEDSFKFGFRNGLANWSPVSSVAKGSISVSSKDFAPKFSLGNQNIQITTPNINFVGKVSLEDGFPVWKIEDFNTELNFKNMDSFEMEVFQSQGDLKFYPQRGRFGSYEASNLILSNDGDVISQGDLSFSFNQNSQINRVTSHDLQISSRIVSNFLFPNIDILDKSTIKINRIDWKPEEINELVVDGLIILPSNESLRNSTFEIPLKWTLVDKDNEYSHWMKLSFKKNSRSDLEISFLTESNLLTFKSERLDLVDLITLFKTIFRPHIENNNFIFGWFKERSNFNSQFSFKTLLSKVSIILDDFEAKLDLSKQKIIFKTNFKGSLIEGNLDYKFRDQNSSEYSTFNLQLSGQDTNASFFNSIINNSILMSGLVNWKLNANGNVGGSYELNSSIEVNNLSLKLLEYEKANVLRIQEEMERSLGSSFSWSPYQLKMIEVFSSLLKVIFFDKGSIELNRNETGECTFSLSNWKGPNITLFGRGEISSDGNVKMNIFPSVKNKWADFLQVINCLAVGKVRKGYRTLKREPLVIEANQDGLKLTNWWKLVGQGMGLEPN